MKVQTMITIDEELKELLKAEDNISGLINDLLHNHFHETPNFRKLRILSRAKEVNRQQELLKKDEQAINQEMKDFIADMKKPKEAKVDVVEDVSVTTYTHGGKMEKDKMREDMGEAQ